jgi:hypothetical protein
MHMKLARVTLLSVALLVAAACGDDDADVSTGDSPTDTTVQVTVPAAPADVIGTITSVTPFEPITQDCTPPEDLDPEGSVSSDDPPVCTPADNDIVGTVLVEEQPGVQEGIKISFTVTSSTELTGAFADLAEGQIVEAWSTGMCAESYPSQCEAVAIRHR